MDILTHTLSGIAVGTVVASFENLGLKNKFKIILASGFAGALPDLDTVSLWSGFDSTIGHFFNLSTSGKVIYSSKYWYSHHAFLHSLFSGLLFTIILALTCYIINYYSKKTKTANFFKRKKLLLIGFFMGYLIHLIEDMPTPASTWGGINFFWPFTPYIGGTGDIWWWNNYDIFLIVIAVILINTILHLFNRLNFYSLKKLTVSVFMFGFLLALYQIKTRAVDFSYTGYTSKYKVFEQQSKQIQKDILGDYLYQIMEKFDNTLKIYF